MAPGLLENAFLYISLSTTKEAQHKKAQLLLLLLLLLRLPLPLPLPLRLLLLLLLLQRPFITESSKKARPKTNRRGGGTNYSTNLTLLGTRTLLGTKRITTNGARTLGWRPFTCRLNLIRFQARSAPPVATPTSTEPE